MRVCSVFNEYDKTKKAVAYLIYYEKSDCFYMEIDDETDSCNLPMIPALFVEQGIYSVDSYWTRKWVNSRIIPTDRQNLGQILKHNGMEYYDEYNLLIKGKGMCSHDDFCVEELALSQIENTILPKRMKQTIKDIVVEDNEILVFFKDDSTEKYEIKQLTDKKAHRAYLEKNFGDAEILPGGYEINWNDIVTVHINSVRDKGERISIPYKYFQKFAKDNIVNTAGACEILGCSRQNVEDLVKRNCLEPVQTSAKNKMFLKKDICEKLW